MRDCVLNFERKSNRWSQPSKQLFASILAYSGPRVLNLITANIGGPGEKAVREALKAKFAKEIDLSYVNMITMEALANHLEAIKNAKNIIGTVACEVQEDETAVNPDVGLQYLLDKLRLIGFCGLSSREGYDHVCDLEGGGIVCLNGSAATLHDDLTNVFRERRIATMMRCIMVTPLHCELPSIAVVMQPVCGRFDNVAVRRQWNAIRAMWAETFGKRGFLLVGHGSDGDSRRRSLMLYDYTRRPLPVNHVELTLDVPGFTMSASLILTADGKLLEAHGLHSQDPNHNGKKQISPLDKSSKELRIGSFLVTMAHVWLLLATDFDHGLQHNDVARTDRQDMGAVIRLEEPRVYRALLRLSAETAVACEATAEYLAMCHRYATIFQSRSLSLCQRISNAAYVIQFLRLWRNSTLHCGGLTIQKNFITRECHQDTIVSCHSAILQILLFQRHLPGVPVALNKTGSDALESHFSSMGGFGKFSSFARIYSVLQAQEGFTKLLQTTSFLYNGSGIKAAKRHRKQEGYFAEQRSVVLPAADLAEVLTEAQMKDAFRLGQAEATAVLTRLKCKPTNMPEKSWSEPWRSDATLWRKEQVDVAPHEPAAPRGDYALDVEQGWLLLGHSLKRAAVRQWRLQSRRPLGSDDETKTDKQQAAGQAASDYAVVDLDIDDSFGLRTDDADMVHVHGLGLDENDLSDVDEEAGKRVVESEAELQELDETLGVFGGHDDGNDVAGPHQPGRSFASTRIGKIPTHVLVTGIGGQTRPVSIRSFVALLVRTKRSDSAMNKVATDRLKRIAESALVQRTIDGFEKHSSVFASTLRMGSDVGILSEKMVPDAASRGRGALPRMQKEYFWRLARVVRISGVGPRGTKTAYTKPVDLSVPPKQDIVVQVQWYRAVEIEDVGRDTTYVLGPVDFSMFPRSKHVIMALLLTLDITGPSGGEPVYSLEPASRRSLDEFIGNMENITSDLTLNEPQKMRQLGSPKGKRIRSLDTDGKRGQKKKSKKVAAGTSSVEDVAHMDVDDDTVHEQCGALKCVYDYRNKLTVEWLICDGCDKEFHQCCTDKKWMTKIMFASWTSSHKWYCTLCTTGGAAAATAASNTSVVMRSSRRRG